MARIDLNIVDRGIEGTDWVAENVGLTAGHLDEVMEQKTDNSGALNSLPTPFARFFVAKEAFRRLTEENLDPKKEAGFAYRQLVSSILDVYELLFNLKYHINNTFTRGQKIELREWKSEENLKVIKNKMPVLFNSINDYYKTDIKENTLYFLVYTEDGKDKLLACSSPLTGFVTPPDMDKSIVKKNNTPSFKFSGSQYENLIIRRKSGGEYFRDIKLFGERDADFKNYMYNVLFSSDSLDERYRFIKEYIRSFKNDPEIRNDFHLQLTNVMTDQNDPLVINGLAFKSSDALDIMSYFNRTIIRVPYRISRDNFMAVKYKNDKPDRDYDYLLPFKPEILNLYEGQQIDSEVHLGRNDITVILKYNNQEFKKTYSEEPLNSTQGRIINLRAARINFDLCLFPNILSYNEAENNYFKVMLVAADEDKEAPNLNVDNISLTFFKNTGKDFIQIKEVDPTENVEFGTCPPYVRSRQKSTSLDGGTKFYELFNTSFDAMEVNLHGDTGLLIPVWNRSERTNDTYTYAIDLGTSNTFISRCKNGENNLPELFTVEKPIVNFLHEPLKDTQLSTTRCIEDSIFVQAKNKIKTEFLPAIIDGKDYKFPIRTALCAIRSNANKPKLFDNHNIAFFYEKLMSNNDQVIYTDIKWEKDEAKLKIFVRELLLIIKCDILQRNGDLNRTRLVWFKPLSFRGTIRSMYEDIWQKEPEEILFIQPSQVDCFSESEAPYYYFKKKNIIPNSDAVSVIDIGGGSTDFVYFQDNKPKLANSVHFGCDVLWDNGFVDFENARENGIYNKYKDTIRFDKDDLNDLNDSMKLDTLVKTKDIINFWLGNSNYCGIVKSLRDDYKPLFLYHFVSILFYMSNMYKDQNLMAPKTVVFSGNGSKYIDSFISSDKRILKEIVDTVFDEVFGGKNDVSLQLPKERKESTCYGGLYRSSDAEAVPEFVYQGDTAGKYVKVDDLVKNYDSLKSTLLSKYKNLSNLYKKVLEKMKTAGILDDSATSKIYADCASKDMGTPFDTYFKTEVREQYSDEDMLFDTVFFLPIINRVFEMTKI